MKHEFSSAPHKELSDAQRIQHVQNSFKKSCEVVDIANQYPEIVTFRRKFAISTFLKQIIPYGIFLTLLIIVAFERSCSGGPLMYYYSQSLTGGY